jgi:peroxiredoxin
MTTCAFGAPAPDFDLVATDGRRYRRDELRGAHGLLVIFMCNHCPYDVPSIDRIVRDAAELAAHGIGSAAICSNDAAAYPEDSFENMKKAAARWHLPFPYLWDKSQEAARAYGAVCTPDFFGYDAKLGLQYNGRLDSAGRIAEPNARRELFDAMVAVARTGKGPADQTAGMGCSIKWRE